MLSAVSLSISGVIPFTPRELFSFIMHNIILQARSYDTSSGVTINCHHISEFGPLSFVSGKITELAYYLVNN